MRRSNRRVATGTQEGLQHSAKFIRVLALRYTHMAAMLFSMMADVKMIHLPDRKSNSAMLDLLAERRTVMFLPTFKVM
jgi:hypothetical protein